MKKIQKSDLRFLALGCALLGSGGGGDPSYELMMGEYLIEEITLLTVDEVDPDGLVVPIGFMGAPLITIERIHSGKEFAALCQKIEATLGKKPSALLATEIGGANAFAPLLASALLDIPVIDGDTLGRAFPEVQMSSCALRGISPSPAFLAGIHGETLILDPSTPSELEDQARKITMEWGSSAALATYLMEGRELQDAIIPNTLSQAIRMGKILEEKGLEALLKMEGGAKLGSGKIVDISQKLEDGFLRGSVRIQGKHEEFSIYYQNEYLLARKGTSPLAASPDILVLLEEGSNRPISSESLSYGLQVELLCLPAPKIWTTKEGRELCRIDWE